MLPTCVLEDLNELGLDVQSDALTPQAGLSGAEVYRIGGYCVKGHSWASLSRLVTLHRAQKRWSESLDADSLDGASLNCVPRLLAWPRSLGSSCPTVLVVNQSARDSKDGRDIHSCWECMEWMEGESIASIAEVTCEQIRSVACSLGRLHRVARRWSAHAQAESNFDERMADRNRLLRQLVQSGFQLQRRRLKTLEMRTELSRFVSMAEEALGCAERIATASLGAMQRLAHRDGPRHWVHGDAWRGNWLFRGERVSGLIDFSQAAVRWPGFDFARAIGSMALSDDTSRWQDAWEHYCRALGDPGYLLDEAILMHRVSMVLTLCWYLEHPPWHEGANDPSLDRLQEVCRQLTSAGRIAPGVWIPESPDSQDS